MFDASRSFDGNGDPLHYRWDFDSDGNWDTPWSANPRVTQTWNDDYSSVVTLGVTDWIRVLLPTWSRTTPTPPP